MSFVSKIVDVYHMLFFVYLYLPLLFFKNKQITKKQKKNYFKLLSLP
jgi:hypothetical protein